MLLSIEKCILFQMDGKHLFVEQANLITIKMTLNEHTNTQYNLLVLLKTYAIVAKYPFDCCSISSYQIHCQLETARLLVMVVFLVCLSLSPMEEKRSNDTRMTAPMSVRKMFK